MSKARLGVRRSPEFCERMRQINLGRKHTVEHRQHNREAKLGKVLPPRSVEYRNKISSALKGKKKSESHKQSLRESKLGFITPEGTKTKMIESHIGGFWYGNIRYYDNPYCEKWTADLRERVRAYFGYVCFECGIPQNGRKLNVHHIHYNKKTCCDGSPHDMVPLCPECHTKTNFSRDYWEDHFTELLYASNPDGKCFFTREEMAALLAT